MKSSITILLFVHSMRSSIWVLFMKIKIRARGLDPPEDPLNFYKKGLLNLNSLFEHPFLENLKRVHLSQKKKLIYAKIACVFQINIRENG